MQNSVLAEVGTNPSDTVAVEGGSNFFPFGETISSSHQNTLKQLQLKMVHYLCGMAFQAVLSTQECLFPLLILAGLYSAKKQLQETHFSIKPVK